MKKVLNLFLAVVITVQASMLPLVAESGNSRVTYTSSTPNISREHIKNDTVPRLWQLERKSSLNTKTKSTNDEIVVGSDINNLPNYFEKELVVKFIDTHDVSAQYSDPLMMDFLWWHQSSVKTYFKDTNTAVLTLNAENADVLEWQERIAKDYRVIFAEPNYISYPQTIQYNDDDFDKQWSLENMRQTVNSQTGVGDADIDMTSASNIKSWKSTTVAVIDTGVDLNHPDLTENLWDGSRCKNEHGDMRGYCKSGYDFQNYDVDPQDDNGHGTHVAGVIAAETGNSRGIAGINNSAKIMALKVGTDFFSNEAVINAINFARYNKADVINASFSGNFYSQAVSDAINLFTDKGGIFVTSAGNAGNDNDVSAVYPCNYEIDGVICVAATDNRDKLSSYSNYGVYNVDLAAPGTDVYSTDVSGDFAYWDVQTFENVIAPNKPEVMDFHDTAGVVKFDNAHWGNVVTGDTQPQYRKNNSSSFYSKQMDLWAADSAEMSFWISCDTEYTMNAYSDYMELHYKNDEGDFERQYTYDEYQIDVNNQMPQDSNGFATMYVKREIPKKYLHSYFQYGFTWYANDNDNVGRGCIVDDIEVRQFEKNEYGDYQYASGTSLAAAHVAGVASYMMGVNSELSNIDIKNLLVYSGDKLESLENKVRFEKRLNAYNAIQLASEPKNVLEEKPWDSEFKHVPVYALNSNISSGDLISVQGHSAVYYYGADKKRHVFPTEKEFYSWFTADDFNNVTVISLEDAAKIPLGKSMIMKPGSLIKEPSRPQVYFVNTSGRLQHVQTPSLARYFFGNLWANFVKDIGASRMLDYTIENPIIDRNASVALDREQADISNSGYSQK